MAEFNAYMRFNGNCREAMEFYKSCLGGELNIMTMADSPMANQMPPEKLNQVMHSVLTNGSVMLMGADMMGEEVYKPCNNLSLVLVCKTQQEAETLFSKLSQGASNIHPLAKVFFGMYGDFTDKYGFNWMFQFGEMAQNKATAQSASTKR
jgi:PhnB protein